jgi:hypothetical protein
LTGPGSDAEDMARDRGQDRRDPEWVKSWRAAWREGVDKALTTSPERSHMVSIPAEQFQSSDHEAFWWLDATQSLRNEPRTGRRIGMTGSVHSLYEDRCSLEILITMENGIMVSVSAARLNIANQELVRNVGEAVSVASLDGIGMLMQDDSETLQNWAASGNEILRRLAATSPHSSDSARTLAYLIDGNNDSSRMLEAPTSGWHTSADSLTHALLTCILTQAEIQRALPIALTAKWIFLD